MNKKTYKNLIIIGLAIIAIIVVLLMRSRIMEDKKYNGFLNPAKGAWSEVMNGAEDSQRSIYLGERVINNILAYGVEIGSIIDGNESAVTQVWRDKDSNEIVKVASKLEGKNEVICIDDSLMEIFIPTFNSSLPAIKTPEEYGLNNEYTSDTFTTKKGKIIQVAKFIDENNMEIWLSSEVPFGIVKIIDRNSESGEIMAWLQDFGLSGGKSKISENEMLNCKKINFPDLTK